MTDIEKVIIRIVIFFANYIARDIPEKVSDTQNTYPNITIDILPYIGASTKMLELLLELVSTHTHVDSVRPAKGK